MHGSEAWKLSVASLFYMPLKEGTHEENKAF
jgi:hypothetical protein